MSSESCLQRLCSCDDAELRGDGAAYCCEACASPSAARWDACQCGHEACRSRRDASPAEREERVAVDIAPGGGLGCSPVPTGLPPE